MALAAPQAFCGRPKELLFQPLSSMKLMSVMNVRFSVAFQVVVRLLNERIAVLTSQAQRPGAPKPPWLTGQPAVRALGQPVAVKGNPLAKPTGQPTPSGSVCLWFSGPVWVIAIMVRLPSSRLKPKPPWKDAAALLSPGHPRLVFTPLVTPV